MELLFAWETFLVGDKEQPRRAVGSPATRSSVVGASQLPRVDAYDKSNLYNSQIFANRSGGKIVNESPHS